MRDVIRNVLQAGNYTHFGYAYDLYAPPLGPGGKVDPEARDAWLTRCQEVNIAEDYAQFYERWKRSFSNPGECAMHEMEASSRVLIGHGNPSGSDVGLTVHHTWGVPVLPGSALKGLTAHYVDVVYGDPEGPERRQWLGPTWTGRRIGAGEQFGRLFGAPAVEDHEESDRRGLVEFHDALYVPRSASGKPFARDVLTVHQKQYYDSQGKSWPNDWDSPNPVGFVTARPGTRFLLVLTGPDDWRDLAMKLMLEALREWGIGGKTSAGYGRLQVPMSRR